MLHLNIKSILDNFLQLASLINNLNIEFKIIEISETWIKPSHDVNTTILFTPSLSIDK